MAVGAPQAAAEAPATKAATQCPSTFRVLHNDRIGPAVLPQGQYVITVRAPGLACATASRLFTQFLTDYDGNLPKGWTVVAQGSGRASFNQNGQPGFSVARSGGGNNPSTYGSVCPASFQVLHNDVIGPLSFPKGSYRLVVPRGSIISCGQAFKLFKQFLNRPAGNLPEELAVEADDRPLLQAGQLQAQEVPGRPGDVSARTSCDACSWVRLGVIVPVLQLGQGVYALPPRRTSRAASSARSGGGSQSISGVADLADLLAGVDGQALRGPGRLLHVHVA